jgi:isopenicillin-N N-acyltransferase-like protein
MPVPFLHVRAGGTYREIGRQIGEAARAEIVAAISFYEEHFAGMAGIPFTEAERQALQYLPHARRWLPQYVDELEGMAEGCDLPFAKLLVPNCAEEFTCPTDADEKKSPHGGPVAGHGCTAVGAMWGGRHVVGHNMDWYVVDADKNVLFDLTMPDGTRILTIAGVPYLPILGMNSHGVAYVGNSVYSNDNRPGVPNAFVRRWVLEAATLEEAYARACMPARARGSNHLLGDLDGRLWDIETSARGAVLVESSAWMTHTNHYVAPAMATYEGYHHDESRRRLAHAQATLAAGCERGEDPLELVTRVLRSHGDSPDHGDALCGHADETLPVADRNMTVASMICDLDGERLLACAGPPCENPYREFSLQGVVKAH